MNQAASEWVVSGSAAANGALYERQGASCTFLATTPRWTLSAATSSQGVAVGVDR